MYNNDACCDRNTRLHRVKKMALENEVRVDLKHKSLLKIRLKTMILLEPLYIFDFE